MFCTVFDDLYIDLLVFIHFSYMNNVSLQKCKIYGLSNGIHCCAPIYRLIEVCTLIVSYK